MPKPSKKIVRRFRREAAKLLLAALTSSVSACQSTAYVAEKLPAELIAPPPIHKDEIDLSRLTGPPARNDVIQPGDLLEVSVTTGIEDHTAPLWPVRVSKTGMVVVPIVGQVPVGGLSFTDAEQRIRDASIGRQKYVAPNVSVSLKQRRTNVVTVVGAVNNPGAYELPVAGSDLLAAIVAAEGLGEDAGTLIEVVHPPVGPRLGSGEDHGGQREAQLASYAASRQDNSQSSRSRIDITDDNLASSIHNRLHDGSVVEVLPRPRRVIKVIGLVNKPDEFEIPIDQEVRLLDALAMSGGRKMEIADRVKIIRAIPGTGEFVTIGASVRRAKQDSQANLVLSSNDVVSVEETPVTFAVQTIRSFVRFGFSSAVPGF